ncbi:hypothetical protein [Streptomyces sp. NPDC002952]|uniref:hypothetical protein n=1 Tax=Streptomyces sp. NPDC002952 TaxID=3364673 RepID=UPI003690B9CD
MTASSWDRSRRVATGARVLTAIAVIAGAAILALGVSLPEAWWPHSGRDTRSVGGDPCALIVGPGKAYCERGTPTRAASKPNVAGAAWGLVSAGAGAAALVVWRLRCAAGQGRR